MLFTSVNMFWFITYTYFHILYRVSYKKCLWFFRKDWAVLFTHHHWIIKQVVMTFKKSINKSNCKKRYFLQYWLPNKSLSLKAFLYIFVQNFNTVSVIDLSFLILPACNLFFLRLWDTLYNYIIHVRKDVLKQSNILCVTVNVFQKSLPFYGTQLMYPFLNSIIFAKHKKGLKFQPMWNPYTLYSFSSVKSLFI